MKKRKILLLTTTTTLFLLTAFPASAGWQKEPSGWRYQSNSICPPTGWSKIDGSWYYFGQNGFLITGWIDDNGFRYYINDDGIMLTGEQVINGKVYIFSNDGHLLSEGAHKDGLEDTLLLEATVSTKEHWNDILYALSLVNQERANLGIAPLEINYDLSIVAAYRAAHMNKYNYFSHYYDGKIECNLNMESYSGSTFHLGENIWLYGSTTNPNDGVLNTLTNTQLIQMAQNDYVNSPKHYVNMIDSRYNQIGIGILKNQVGTRDYVTMLFNKK